MGAFWPGGVGPGYITPPLVPAKEGRAATGCRIRYSVISLAALIKYSREPVRRAINRNRTPSQKRLSRVLLERFRSAVVGQGCVSPTWSNSEASSFSGAFTRVEIGHMVRGSDG
jgi:hypothetical protein